MPSRTESRNTYDCNDCLCGRSSCGLAIFAGRNISARLIAQPFATIAASEPKPKSMVNGGKISQNVKYRRGRPQARSPRKTDYHQGRADVKSHVQAVHKVFDKTVHNFRSA